MRGMAEKTVDQGKGGEVGSESAQKAFFCQREQGFFLRPVVQELQTENPFEEKASSVLRRRTKEAL
jgi:hypothetical protein